ncbi:MAG: MATE family efflux transporter [Rubricoccaceae bacterium]|nr:MATE family efflux transporter [Rubricoccaceae bacterium]
MAFPQALVRELRATMVLSVPFVLTQLAQMSMSFVDVIMVGRLGPAAMAAAVLGSTIYFTLLMVCTGVVMAVNPMVAQAYGAGDAEEVSRSVRQGLWLATMLGIPLVLILQPAGWLMQLLGQERHIAVLADSYLWAMSWGIFPNLWFTALRGFCEGLGRPRPVLIVTLVAIALNVFGNWVLMYGKFGFPALGLEGCGWSSAIVYGGLFLMTLAYVQYDRGFRLYQVFSTIRKPDREHFQTLLRLGWPIGTQFGLEAGLFLTATLLVGLFGEAALAAHQVALNASSVTFMVPLGIGMAATVRVGQLTGARNHGGAARAGWTAIAFGTLFMCCSALLFWLRPEWVVWLYTGQETGGQVGEDVVKLAAVLLGVAAVFQIFDGLQATAAGSLRGLKDTRVPMLIGALSYWVIGIGTALVLGFGLDWGARGVWWGLTLGLLTAAVLLNARFFRLTLHRRSVV